MTGCAMVRSDWGADSAYLLTGTEPRNSGLSVVADPHPALIRDPNRAGPTAAVKPAACVLTR